MYAGATNYESGTSCNTATTSNTVQYSQGSAPVKENSKWQQAVTRRSCSYCKLLDKPTKLEKRLGCGEVWCLCHNKPQSEAIKTCHGVQSEVFDYDIDPAPEPPPIPKNIRPKNRLRFVNKRCSYRAPLRVRLSDKEEQNA